MAMAVCQGSSWKAKSAETSVSPRVFMCLHRVDEFLGGSEPYGRKHGLCRQMAQVQVERVG